MGDAHLLHSYSAYLGSAWDLHNLELGFNTDLSLVRESSCMTASTPPTYYGSTTLDVSTGYLEDAFLVDHYTTPSAKRRRRSLLYDQHHQIPNNLCNSGGYRWWVQSDDNLNCITQTMFSSDEVGIVKTRNSNMEEEEEEEEESAAPAAGGVTLLFQEDVTTKLETTKMGLIDNDTPNSSNSSSFTTCNHPPAANHLPSSASGESSSNGSTMTRRRKTSKVIKGLVYPFEVVKPGGDEGELTLNDINERMLMPPTRPVRHPVGDYACHPRPYYGPGLSGKAVVALTTIHTQGRRGTITIIRTRP